MAVLPLLGAAAGWAVGGTATAAMVGMSAASLLSSAMDEGESQGSGSVGSAISPPTAPGSSTMPQPGTLLSQPAANPGDIGAGLEETNPAEAKKVSMAAQSRRRGRRATILTGEDSGEEAEFLGGI